MKRYFGLLVLLFLFSACKEKANQKGTFAYDLAFLKQYHQDLVLLKDPESDAQLIVLPAYQGRVMTSTSDGEKGMSYGWINYDLIAKGTFSEQFTALGGEERLWFGPEGGQFALYFKKGSEFTFDNWYVPKAIDSEPFNLISSSATEAKFEKTMHLENYAGTAFDLKVNRTISLLDQKSISDFLGYELGSDIHSVGFQSENILTNTGSKTWDQEAGLLSIWVLSMLKSNDQTNVIIPYRKGDSLSLGKIVTDDYFGKLSSDRLKIEDGHLLFKADAKQRSKIGVSPKRALPIAGSYDAENKVLTIAQFTLPEGITTYVNSTWKIQEDPFVGDAVNAYTDGPIDGKQMGKFYELESSSPALSLAPGANAKHIHRTIHLSGPVEKLNEVSLKLFGLGLDQFKF
ncbi:DUF6786 family protein [Daejeonella sp.]|uniref:DUF6786 family protein n=1 Tax=Daejeonella sp. TaxID=2805397 RepID=UPI00271F9B14|nr:DUF6786 family protein [Daejeonella sp.]MDO8993896.1 hypothetical protein [Daejeonella sp.]MDP2415635.1 hypothetical protein [Daejeonella sp.]